MKHILIAKDDVKVPVDEKWITIVKGSEVNAEITGGIICIKFDINEDDQEYSFFKKSDVDKYFDIKR